MLTRFFVTLAMASSLSCCKSRAEETSTSLAGSGATQVKKVIQGYDLSGFQTLDLAPKGMICTMVLRPEEARCQEVGGKTLWADKCKPLCSKPIAPEGKVAGYNFSSFVIADALPGNMACAAVVSPEQEACFEAGGKTQIAAKCRHLCSVPIAERGKVSGFNFDGPQIAIPALPKGFACAQVLRPEEESCRKAGGKVTIADKCAVLCSVMISR